MGRQEVHGTVDTTASNPAGGFAANTKQSASKLTGRAIRLLAILFCCVFWAGVVLAIIYTRS